MRTKELLHQLTVQVEDLRLHIKELRADIEKLQSDVTELQEQREEPKRRPRVVQVPPEKAAERRRELDAEKRMRGIVDA